MIAHSSGDLMIRIFKTIGYILLDYIVRENLNLNVYLLRSNALFLWRQEDTSSLRLLSDDRSGRQIIKNLSLRQRLHLLLELL